MRLRALLGVLLCVSTTPGQSRPVAALADDATRPSVLLITVDTLRPDALGWAGGGQPTPAIDRLAAGAFSFPAAVSPVPLTLPAHAALLTGLLPRRLGLQENGQIVPATVPTLAETLERAGYATAAFVSGYPLDSAFGLDRGFQRYDDGFSRTSEGELERPAALTAEAAAAWLRSAPEPWFAWVHFYDPHYPYEPPPRFRRPGPRGGYDGEVAFVDEGVATLESALRSRRGPRLTVFCGDHGESLGEHGEGTHGFFIYDSTVVVPLFFRLPGRIAPASSRMPVRLLDVAPTVLRLAGLSRPGPMDGVSLEAQLLGGAANPQPAYVETLQPWLSYGWAPLRAVRHGGFKLIEAPRPELYDLDADPTESRNLFTTHAAKAGELRRLMEREEPLPGPEARTLDDPKTVERLRALGYVGGPAPEATPARSDLRDPKDGGELRELLTRGDQALRERRYAAALGPFEDVLARDPDNRFALLRAGTAFSELGHMDRAIVLLRRLVRLAPRSADGRQALAVALQRAKRPADAVEQWEEAVRLQPRRAGSWAQLGSALGLAGREREAVEAFEEAVQLEPAEPAWLIRLAFAKYGIGHAGDAADTLLRAVELTGVGAFPHPATLGVLLAQTGRRAEARTWLRRARPGEGDFAEARFQLALLEAEMGRPADARAALAEALIASPALRARAAGDPRLRDMLP